jgi:hypothetical protein
MILTLDNLSKRSFRNASSRSSMVGWRRRSGERQDNMTKRIIAVSIFLVGVFAVTSFFSRSLQRLILVCLTAMGCMYSPADEYVTDHTEYDWYDNNDSGFVIDLLMEESDDYALGVIDSKMLLTAQMVVYKEADSQYDSLKSVTAWVAHSMDSWNAFNGISPDGSESYEDTMCIYFESYDIDDFVVAISPRAWQELDRKTFLQFFLHELVHYISAQEHDGDSDHNHTREEYWGKGGLLERLLNKTIEAL